MSDLLLICVIKLVSPGGSRIIRMIQDMLSSLDLCCPDPPQHIMTAGQDIVDDPARDLSDLSDPCVKPVLIQLISHVYRVPLVPELTIPVVSQKCLSPKIMALYIVRWLFCPRAFLVFVGGFCLRQFLATNENMRHHRHHQDRHQQPLLPPIMPLLVLRLVVLLAKFPPRCHAPC